MHPTFRLAIAAMIALGSSISANSSLEPTHEPTLGTTLSFPPPCGTILTNDGNDLTLGPYSTLSDERNADAFHCNTGTGQWFAHSYYNPMYLYAFQLTQRCEYQFRTPEGNLEWQNLRDVNSWFEQAAKTFQRPDNVGYKASDDDIIFSGLQVPNFETDLIIENIEDCPENFCVKVVGPSITRQSLGSKYNTMRKLAPNDTGEPELLYAFSNKDAHETFYKMMRNAMKSSNNHHIFLTNHFTRCGCESFCMDEDKPNDAVDVQATCYVEELCGQRVFQIAYTDEYPEDRKVAWASAGTTEVMEWFNECSSAMYGCTEHEESDINTFKGTNYNSHYNGYSKVFEYDSWKGASNVYGLGGDKYYGFPDSNTSDEPLIAWACPTVSHQAELRRFGEFVASAEFFRDAGLESSVPVQQNPCAQEIFNPPEPPFLPPPLGPDCTDVDHVGYCYQMPGATCYAAKAVETCAEVDLVMVNETSTYIFGDVADWADACIDAGTNCRKDERHAEDHGTLLYTGVPHAIPFYLDNDAYEWYFMLSNMKKDGADTVDGSIYYNCDTWENAFGAQNFTNSAGARYSVFGNTYGDLWKVREGECTPSPTELPGQSLPPSATPTGVSSASPTFTSSSIPTSTLDFSSNPSDFPTVSPTARPTIPSSESPTTLSTKEWNTEPTTSPLSDPNVYIAPIDILPQCFDGPMIVQKDSGSMEMGNYNQDMVQINDMNTADVTLAINNVWAQDDLPEQLSVFIHNNGVNAILDGQDGDGFQCLNTEGSDIDIEGENEFTVNCFQESQGDPWLAVIDVVVTDESICGDNDAPHPCFPDHEPILGSCSWRIVIPCSYNLMCPEAPSSTPTSSSTGTPTTLWPSSGTTISPTTSIPASFSPTISPNSTPKPIPTHAPTVANTAAPTATPTAFPTANLRTTTIPTAIASSDSSSLTNPSISPTDHGIDENTVDASFRAIGPMDCPADILLLNQNGSTAYPDDAVQIIRQDTKSVTVKLTQTYTDSSSSIDSVYYQYKHNYFDRMCFEEQNFYGEESLEFTIQCTVHSRIALLELWVADDITKGVLSEGDSGNIPNCCHPTVPEGTPVTNFVIEIKCSTTCPEVIE